MSHEDQTLEGIAVVGLSGRFPGAKNIEEFWNNLREGVESVRLFTDEELLAAGVSPAKLEDPNFVKAGATLDGVADFDAAFFGFNPREAEIMDPQHRLFLETAWSAMEHAGYDPDRYDGTVSVFAGTGISRYMLFNLLPNRELVESVGQVQLMITNDKDYVATRTSHKLNLKGASVSLSTACSTSLTAVHLACQSLLVGETDMALAGGVSIAVPQTAGYTYVNGSILSPDGHCRAFDENAKGTVPGSGLGVVVLKRLEDAVADGDTVYAVIKGTAISNDGAQKVGFTAPGVEGQSQAIAEALAIADVEPDTVSYIEAHGTGTELGDPIEISALTQAFQLSTDRTGFCKIGSVKTNVGHLDAAAGVTGLIKTVLSLQHGEIPPTLNFAKANGKIDFDNSPFVVNTELTPWETDGTPRRAGVSSFGLGGTNVHAVLEEAPVQESEDASRPWQLLLLSAKTDAALEAATDNLAQHLTAHPEQQLADVAYTLQMGRKGFAARRALVVQNHAEAAAALAERDPQKLMSRTLPMQERPVAFLFTGVGDQYVNMGYELYQTEALFQETVDECCEILKKHLGADLRDLLFDPERAAKGAGQAGQAFDLRKMLRREETADPQAQKLNETLYAQPAMFVIEYALSRLLMAWGIQPQAMIGHSLGEYVAACHAGVFELEDALMLIAKRAQLIQELPGGAMLAVPMSAEDAQGLLTEGLYLATVNAPKHVVLSGTQEKIAELEARLQGQGIACSRVHSTHPFHSPLMEPIAAKLTELVRAISPQEPQIPFLSNVTGTWATADDVTDPAYWARHLCQTVRFADGVRALAEDPNLLLLEVGPGQTLSSFAAQTLTGRTVLPTLKASFDQRSDAAFLLGTLGQLWLEGVEIDWQAYTGEERRLRVPLPTYPFERHRYWIEPLAGATVAAASVQEVKTDVADWFSLPVWKRTLAQLPAAEQAPSRWLVFADEGGLGRQLSQQLSALGHEVFDVTAGESYQKNGAASYVINPASSADYEQVMRDLLQQDKTPAKLLHLFSVTGDRDFTGDFETAQTLGFYSLLNIAKTVSKLHLADLLELWVIADQISEIESADEPFAEKATLLAACKVIPQEYANITCRALDIRLPQANSRQAQRLQTQLLNEFAAGSPDRLVGFRGQHRFVQTFEPHPLPQAQARPKFLRENGVYLITGGLGTFGTWYAEYLAQTVQAKLVLVSRTPLPPREQWADPLAAEHGEDKLSARTYNVRRLEALGAEVRIFNADVADVAQMRDVIAATEAEWGQIHGVIHAAGLVDPDTMTTIAETTVAECEPHFRPRVGGAYVLQQLFADKLLDFCLINSSLSSVLGGSDWPRRRRRTCSSTHLRRTGSAKGTSRGCSSTGSRAQAHRCSTPSAACLRWNRRCR
ncbi:type I polyketide synthase [Tumebacillus avium]|uniref:type I polyketide synthase n=1 Tax=Tumebacillus avium TaxID=1903704 RepID=UPI0018DF23C7|nr:type I polyketide synthase [Tumebacillus avium]